MQPIRRRGRLSALLAGAVVASSLATAVATAALAPTAGAVNGQPTAVSTACNYRPFDGKWHMADVLYTATPSVTTVAPGGAVALSATTVQTTLLPEMAQIGYSAGLLKAGQNTIAVEAWVGIESVNATPRFQVVKATGSANVTITPGANGSVQATPIVANLTVPNTNWTATTSAVSFRPAPAGTVNGQWPNPSSLPGDKTGGIKGGQYVVAELPGDGTPFELTLDCYPGTVDIDGNPTANYAPTPFATVGNVVTPPVDPEEPEEPEEPEPVDGNWDCISGLGRYRQREIQPMDVNVSFPSVPQVVGARVVLPKVRASIALDAELAKLLYQANLIPVGSKTLPLEGWIYLAGSNTVERQQRVKVDTTYTTTITDPTPDVRNSGDEVAAVITKDLDFGPVFWTPVANGDVSFTLAAPGQNNAPKIDVVGHGYADVPYSIRPYGQLFLRAGTVKVVNGAEVPNYGANLDCAAATLTVADATIPYHNFGNGVRNPDNNTDPNTGSRGRYAIAADPLGVIGQTVYGDPATNTFDCISGLGRYRGREIEPMAITVRQPDPAVVSGGKVRVPRTLVDITITEGLLKSLYQGNQLVNGVNTEKLFGWVHLNGSNTVERTKRLSVETIWQVTVNDPTPDNKANSDETITAVKQTLDFGSTTWTPVSRGDVTFSLVNPGGNSAPKIDVVGKGYADTPYSIRPYGNVFLRAETANYGANLDCAAGKVAIADPNIPYHNFGNDPRNPDDNLASGSRGRYGFTPAPAAAISQAVYGDPTLNTFDCISGLGRYRQREIEPFNLKVSFPQAPVVSGQSITVPNTRVEVNVTSGLLKSLYAAGQFDNTALATDFTTSQKLEGWVYVQGTGTVEKAQRLYLDGTYEVNVKDPTPAVKTNSDETITALNEVLDFGPSTWTPAGPSKVSFALAAPGQVDAPKIDVIGTGYADTPYSIRPFGSVFLRAGTDHYGANLDCSPGKVTIADPAIPYHNFGNDPRNPSDNLQSGSRGRYAFAPTAVNLGNLSTGTAIERFVNDTYKSPLGLNRTVDAPSLAHWVGLLEKGMITRTGFTTAVLRSREGRINEINRQYRHVLGRNADAYGINLWVDRFNRGASRESLTAYLLASAEVRQKAGGTNFGVIDLWWGKVFGAQPDDAARTAWAARFSQFRADTVAGQLVTGTGGFGALVDKAYTTINGSAPSAPVRAALVKKLQTGTSSESLVAQLLADAAAQA